MLNTCDCIDPHTSTSTSHSAKLGASFVYQYCTWFKSICCVWQLFYKPTQHMHASSKEQSWKKNLSQKNDDTSVPLCAAIQTDVQLILHRVRMVQSASRHKTSGCTKTLQTLPLMSFEEQVLERQEKHLIIHGRGQVQHQGVRKQPW